MKTIVTLILLILPVQLSAQISDGAVLVDSFTNAQCNDYLARIDNFFNKLQEDPAAKGIVVIKGPAEELRRLTAYELWFEGAVGSRKLDPSRTTIVRDVQPGEATIEFWTVPANADPQFRKAAAWNFELASNAKPFVFHDGMEQICSSPNFARVYQEYLDSNPTARANVVVFASSRKMYLKGLSESKAELSSISNGRIKYFYKHTKTTYPWAEYWIVPRS